MYFVVAAIAAATAAVFLSSLHWLNERVSQMDEEKKTLLLPFTTSNELEVTKHAGGVKCVFFLPVCSSFVYSLKK